MEELEDKVDRDYCLASAFGCRIALQIFCGGGTRTFSEGRAALRERGVEAEKLLFSPSSEISIVNFTDFEISKYSLKAILPVWNFAGERISSSSIAEDLRQSTAAHDCSMLI